MSKNINTNEVLPVSDAETFSLNSEEPKMSETATKPEAAPKPEKTAAPKKSIGVKIPAETEKTVARKSLTFDRRLQMRSQMIDEPTVERYKELYKENAKTLPPVRVMEIPQAEADEMQFESRYIVWDGFQRGEAASRAKLDKMAVKLSTGSYALARLLAMQANHDAALPRNSADLRRAFHELLNDEKMLAKVLAWGKGQGGPQRALAAAAGISKSLVNKILGQMGKTTNKAGVVDLAGGPRGSNTGTGTAPHDRGRDPVGGLRTESKEAIAKRTTAVLIKEMQYEAAALQRRVEALLSRDDAANLFREICSKNGHPITRDTHKPKGKGRTKEVTTEYLPAVDALLAIMDEVHDQHAKLSTTPGK